MERERRRRRRLDESAMEKEGCLPSVRLTRGHQCHGKMGTPPDPHYGTITVFMIYARSPILQ